MAKINLNKKESNKNNFIENKPKLPYLGKRVKKLVVYESGFKFEFLVQANKNHGICNIVSIDRINNQLHRIPEAISHFQGQQYDHPDIMYKIENYLIDHVLNK